jgi:hypothetical protein
MIGSADFCDTPNRFDFRHPSLSPPFSLLQSGLYWHQLMAAGVTLREPPYGLDYLLIVAT